jgi:hypothetical protein
MIEQFFATISRKTAVYLPECQVVFLEALFINLSQAWLGANSGVYSLHRERKGLGRFP